MPIHDVTRKKLRGDLRARLLQITVTKLKTPELNEWLNVALDNVQMELGNMVDLHYGVTELVDTSDKSHLYRSSNIIYLRSESKNPFTQTGAGVDYNATSFRLSCSTGFTDDEWNKALVMFGDGNDFYFSSVTDTVSASDALVLDVDVVGVNITGDTNTWAIVAFPDIDRSAKMKLVDGTNGIIPFIDADSYENLSDIGFYDNEIFAVLHGNEIRLAKGTDVTYGTITLWYRRRPIKMLLDKQPMDLPSEFKDLVIKSAMIIALEKMGQYQEMAAIKTKLSDKMKFIRSSYSQEKGTTKTKIQPDK